MPPFAKVSSSIPGSEAILTFSRDAFALALVWVSECLVAIKTTS